MASKPEPIDNIDMNEFLNLDHSGYPSPMPSSASSTSRAKSIPTPEFTTAVPNNVFLPPQQPSFAGPSHQYDSYKQQTGLPMGAITKIPVVNPAGLSHFDVLPRGMAMASTNYFGMNTIPVDDDEFDFNALPEEAFNDMDFSPTADSFHGQVNHTGMTNLVDPQATAGMANTLPPTSFANPPRMYPGMHQQQAREAQRQQQMRAMQHARQSSNSTRHSSMISRPQQDPLVEETIARILKEGRQTSIMSLTDDAFVGSGSSRMHKAEDDLDPDEKLLASEEGKKLSSKERRQLRNKVSARAFRSRRKDYITQLEEAAAIKVQEAEKLRDENAALKAENTRLTELSNLLLGSPSFQNFLEDMGRNPLQLPQAVTLRSQPSQQQSQPSLTGAQQGQQHTRKDPNPYTSHDAHIGFAFLPETTLDLSATLPSSANTAATGSWATDVAFAPTTVGCWAVTTLPSGPNLDPAALCGKSTTDYLAIAAGEPLPKDVPAVLEPLPALLSDASHATETAHPTADPTVPFDDSNPAFALFADAPAPAWTEIVDEFPLFGPCPVEKVLACIDLRVDGEDDGVGARTMARFAARRAALETVAARIANVTAHL